MKKCLVFIASMLLLNSCSDADSNNHEELVECAETFAAAYFNLDYQKASELVTTESVKWLNYAASNVTQEDVDLYNAQSESAQVSVNDVTSIDDTTSIVAVTVGAFLQKDSITRPSHMVEEASFDLTVVRRGKQYLVKMEGLPRSGRQNHD